MRQLKRANREMPRRTLATRLFDELAQQLALRSVPRTSDPKTAEIPGTLSGAGNEHIAAPEPIVRALLYLVSLGVVAAATVGVFFGVGFFLLAHPREEMIVGSEARDRGVVVEPRRSDLFPDTDVPPLSIQAELSHPAPASPAGKVATSTIPGASSSGETSTSAEATFVPPAGVTHAKRAGFNAGASHAIGHGWQEKRSRRSAGSEEVRQLNRAQLGD